MYWLPKIKEVIQHILAFKRRTEKIYKQKHYLYDLVKIQLVFTFLYQFISIKHRLELGM